MEIINLYIFSSVDALITINDTISDVITRFKPKLHIQTDESQIFFTIHPIENSSNRIFLPHTIMLNNVNSKLICSDKTTILTQFSPNTYAIEFLPISIDLPSTSDVYIPKDNFSFSLHHNTACFTNSSKSVFYPIKEHITDIKIDLVSDKIFLHATAQQTKSYALILDKEFCVLFESVADKIEFDGNRVITLNKLYTIAQHGQVSIFTLQNNNFVKTDSYTVYLQSAPIPPANQFAVAFAFLEAISLKDLSLARRYLHPNLSALLGNQTLVEFFGNFNSFQLDIEKSPPIMMLTYESSPQFVKYFTFTIQNNLITNISAH